MNKHTDSSTNATFVDKAVFEHNEDHKESRVSGVTETSLYENPISEVDFSNLAFIIVELNSPNTTSLFESRSSDLPSPPPKGEAITFLTSIPGHKSCLVLNLFTIVKILSVMKNRINFPMLFMLFGILFALAVFTYLMLS